MGKKSEFKCTIHELGFQRENKVKGINKTL